MTKGFLQIFKETFNPDPPAVDADGYTSLELEITDDAQKLVVQMLMNEGALRDREYVRRELMDTDAPWVLFAVKFIDGLPKGLPLDE